MPTTLRNLALLNLCPQSLRDRLYDNTAVATGTMPFDELENLIMTNVHQKWSDRKVGLHNIEPEQTGDGLGDTTFELGGEIYKLELKNGRRTPVKQNVPNRKSLRINIRRLCRVFRLFEGI